MVIPALIPAAGSRLEVMDPGQGSASLGTSRARTPHLLPLRLTDGTNGGTDLPTLDFDPRSARVKQRTASPPQGAQELAWRASAVEYLG